MNEEQAIQTTLAKFPNARPTPVKNVAYWNDGKMANSMNLAQDTRAYGWKGDTLKAIRYVLKLQNKIWL